MVGQPVSPSPEDALIESTYSDTDDEQTGMVEAGAAPFLRKMLDGKLIPNQSEQAFLQQVLDLQQESGTLLTSFFSPVELRANDPAGMIKQLSPATQSPGLSGSDADDMPPLLVEETDLLGLGSTTTPGEASSLNVVSQEVPVLELLQCLEVLNPGHVSGEEIEQLTENQLANAWQARFRPELKNNPELVQASELLPKLGLLEGLELWEKPEMQASELALLRSSEQLQGSESSQDLPAFADAGQSDSQGPWMQVTRKGRKKRR